MIPNTIAARKPNDMIVASTFSRVLSSIDASFAGLSGRSSAAEIRADQRPYKDELLKDKKKSFCNAITFACSNEFL
jgi:hypothetical protein